MKTRHASRFAGEVQGKPGRVRRTAAVTLALVLTAALSGPAPVLADGASAPPATYGPPPDPPSGSAWDSEDEARRDVRMGTVDHMRLGREDDGSVIMEIRPRPKKPQDQPQTGPIYVYPQIGNLPGQQTGTPGQSSQSGGQQPGQSGRPGQQPGMPPAAPGGQGGPWNPANPAGGAAGSGQPSGPQSNQGAPAGQWPAGGGS